MDVELSELQGNKKMDYRSSSKPDLGSASSGVSNPTFHTEFQPHSPSLSVPAGMNTSISGIIKEQPLTPSRRSLPCLAQSQTLPINLNRQSSQQPSSQKQTLSAGPSSTKVAYEKDIVPGSGSDESVLGYNSCHRCQSKSSPQEPFDDCVVCLDEVKEWSTIESEQRTYDSRTDHDFLLQNTLTRQSAEVHDEARVGAEHSEMSFGLYFKDGKKRIDYILVYKISNIQVEKRSTFEKNLRAEGLQLERERSLTNSDIMFVKLHAPWETICKYAERMNIRMPFRKKCYYTDWKNKAMSSVSLTEGVNILPNIPCEAFQLETSASANLTCVKAFLQIILLHLPQFTSISA